MVNIRQVHRLATHEDKAFIHKVLGCLALGHIGHRMNLVFKFADSQLTRDPLTPFWMMIHVLLHVSSFQFILSSKRNKHYNIIWPEFRLHSMIFAYRSVFAILLAWIGGYWNHALRGPLVIGTMAAADLVSSKYGQDTTMRGNPYPIGTSQEFITWHNRFYSMSQFGATMAIMFRGADSALMALLPIQTAPFFMTLVKKGILTQGEWHVLYTYTLLTNWLHALAGRGNDSNTITTFQYMFIFIAATIARLKYGVNKYKIWMTIWGLKRLVLE